MAQKRGNKVSQTISKLHQKDRDCRLYKALLTCEFYGGLLEKSRWLGSYFRYWLFVVMVLKGFIFLKKDPKKLVLKRV